MKKRVLLALIGFILGLAADKIDEEKEKEIIREEVERQLAEKEAEEKEES